MELVVVPFRPSDGGGGGDGDGDEVMTFAFRPVG
jgi:hypothetical protein